MRLEGFLKPGEPPITRFVAVELAKDHYFDIEVANRDLGYKATVDMETALKATIEDLKAWILSFGIAGRKIWPNSP